MSCPSVFLLVEDDDDDAFFMKRAFRDAGLRNPLQIVNDGEQAIHYLSGANGFSDRHKFPLPDMIFLDLKMPGLNGFQVARQLRSQFSRNAMKLILMSGMSMDESLAQDAKKAGFDACIDKGAEPALWLRHLAPAGASQEGEPL